MSLIQDKSDLISSLLEDDGRIEATIIQTLGEPDYVDLKDREMIQGETIILNIKDSAGTDYATDNRIFNLSESIQVWIINTGKTPTDYPDGILDTMEAFYTILSENQLDFELLGSLRLDPYTVEHIDNDWKIEIYCR